VAARGTTLEVVCTRGAVLVAEDVFPADQVDSFAHECIRVICIGSSLSPTRDDEPGRDQRRDQHETSEQSKERAT